MVSVAALAASYGVSVFFSDESEWWEVGEVIVFVPLVEYLLCLDRQLKV